MKVLMGMCFTFPNFEQLQAATLGLSVKSLDFIITGLNVVS